MVYAVPFLHGLLSTSLTDAKKVVVSGHSSSYKHVHAGVPQGSILGPFLFLVYVSDMTQGLQSQVHQFADDINLLETSPDPTHSVATINHDLDLLYLWSIKWRVTFNPAKTNFMVFTLKKTTHSPPPNIVQ